MNAQEEYLYTDYAMQLITAFSNEGASDMKTLLSTYEEEEINDPSFLPGLIFGFLVHCQLLLSCVSLKSEIDSEDLFQEYARYYNSQRDTLREIEPLNPSIAKEAFKQFILKGGDL